MQQGQCLITTEGSASNDMMSFTWKIVDVNGNAYFCHTGPAFGKESLFRAEAYDILPVLWCMYQWMEHNKIENKMYTTVYLDNKGIIERIAKQQTYPFDYSFHTINPDWDIIAQICNILELMNIKAEFQHMKGHQDNVKYYEELNLPAQLNINVDFLAINYRTTRGMQRTKVPRLPNNKAQLHMSDTTITSKYHKNLCNHATTKPLIEHLEEKNDWDSFTIQQIYWKAFTVARKHNSHRI
eukprot:2773344-Ditylum_brightwellii.AAC.1